MFDWSILIRMYMSGNCSFAKEKRSKTKINKEQQTRFSSQSLHRMTRRCFSHDATYLPSGCQATDVTIVLKPIHDTRSIRNTPLLPMFSFEHELALLSFQIPDNDRTILWSSTSVSTIRRQDSFDCIGANLEVLIATKRRRIRIVNEMT